MLGVGKHGVRVFLRAGHDLISLCVGVGDNLGGALLGASQDFVLLIEDVLGVVHFDR